jgi:hypothetical protein
LIDKDRRGWIVIDDKLQHYVFAVVDRLDHEIYGPSLHSKFLFGRAGLVGRMSNPIPNSVLRDVPPAIIVSNPGPKGALARTSGSG